MKFWIVQQFAFGTDLGAYGLVKEKFISLKAGGDEATLLLERLGEVGMVRKPNKGKYILPAGIWEDYRKNLPASINEIGGSSGKVTIQEISGNNLKLANGFVWFFFVQNNNFFTGALQEAVWRSFGIRDPYDQAFQEAVNSSNDVEIPFCFSAGGRD